MKVDFLRFLITVFGLGVATASFSQSKSCENNLTLTAESIGLPTSLGGSPLKCPGSATTCNAPISFPSLTLGTQSCLNTQCNTSAAAGPDFPGNNCYDFTGPTAWFQFTAPAGTATMNITVSGATFANPYFMVFGTTNCSTYTLYNDGGECYSGTGGTVTGNMAVPPGTTLLIAVSGASGQSGNFNLCITPQADASACNINDLLAVTATSMGSPLAGPYLPGETVSFCYTINEYVQANCNWLHGIVPTFGDCWDPSSFTPAGQPAAVTTSLQQEGSFCAGGWGWWPNGVVTLGNPGPAVGAGWFFSEPAGSNPNNSWGDGNGSCGAVGMGDCCSAMGDMGTTFPTGCDPLLTWQVCFNLTVRSDCENGTNCAVSMKTYADGQTGRWTSTGCVADLPAVFSAAAICCQMVVNAGSAQTICSNSGPINLGASVTNNEGPTTYQWTASPVAAQAGISNPNILNPTFTPPPGVTGPVVLTLTVTDDNCTIANQVTITVTELPTATISYAGTPFCTSVTTAQPVTISGTGNYLTGSYSASPGGLVINASSGAITPSTSTPGTYTVSYTIPAAGGCPQVVAQTTVTITQNPTATIDYADPFCTSDVGTEPVIINGTGTYLGGGYAASGGLVIDPITGAITPSSVTGGTYTVTYTIPEVNGCPATPVQTTVVITPQPTAVIDYADPFCTSLTTAQSVSISGTGTFNGGLYSADPAGLTISSSTGAITPSTSTPDNYVVTYTIPAVGGCAATPVTTPVTITLAPTATIDYADPFCTSDIGTESVTIVGAGNFVGGTYSASGGLVIDATSGDITPSSVTGGTYTVFYTIPAFNGCAETIVQTTVVITPQPTAVIDYADPFCESSGNQLVSLSGTGTFNGGGFTADPAGLIINGSSGTITPTGSLPNTYTVTYTIPAVGGCVATPVITTVVINPVPSYSLTGSSPNSCNGTDGFITISGLTPGTDYSITYNDDATPVGPITATADGSGEIEIPNLNAGSYDNFSVSFVSSGCGFTSPTTVNLINPGAPVLVDPADVVICAPNTYILPTIAGTDLIGNEAYYTGPNGTGTQLLPGDVISTTTLLYVYATNGPCTDQRNFTIAVNTPPTANIVYNDNPFCANTAGSFSVELTGTNAFNGGSYSADPGLTINTTTGNVTPSTSSTGTFTVYYDIPASGGCPADQVTTTVTVTPVPTAAISYAGPFCNSQGVQPVNLTGTNAFTGGLFASTAGLTIDPSTGEINASTSTPNTYTVTYSIPDGGGCPSTNVQTTLTITAGPTATISYAGHPFCNTVNTAQGVTLNGSGAFTGGSYSSDPVAGLTLNTGNGNIIPSTSTPGDYLVSYTIPASGGCPEGTVSFNVTITENPTASISYDGPFCSTEGVQPVISSGTGVYTGGSFSAGIGLSIDPSTGEIDPTNSAPNTYNVSYVIPEINGCAQSTVNTSVTITPGPTASISYAGHPFCNTVNTAQGVTLSGTGAYLGGSYSSDPVAGLTLNSGNGNIVPSSSTPGDYLVSYTIPASGGCPEGTVSFNVTITENPTASLAYDSPFCSTDGVQSALFSGTGNYSGGGFASTGGLSLDAATGEIDPSSSTPNSYTVTYTIPEFNGCASSQVTANLTITPAPTASISYADPFCDNLATNQVVTLNGTGNFLGGDYSADPAGLSLNAGNGGILPSASAPGTYTVTYTTPEFNGCLPADWTTTVTINATPDFTVAGTDPSACNLSDGFIEISGLDASTTYSVSFTQNGLTQGPDNFDTDATGMITIPNLAAGNYGSFQITANGCTGSLAQVVSLLNPNAPTIFSLPSVVRCDEYTLPAIDGNNLSGNQAFYAQQGGLGTQFNPGDIITTSQTLYAYDIDGACWDEEPLVITINITPTLNNPGDQIACDSYDLPVITGDNLSGSQAYLTPGGVPITGPITSSQTIFIYDQNGTCFDEVSFTVTINPSPVLTSISGGAVYCEGDAVADIIVEVTGSPDFTLGYTLNGTAQTVTSSTGTINLGNAPGTYVVNSLEDAGCTATISGTETIVVNPVPVAPIAGDDATYCYYDQFAPMYAQASLNGALTWYSDAGLTQQVGSGESLLPSTVVGTYTYYVVETAANCQGPATLVSIVVEQCETEIPTAFTPDGDGTNDFWIIPDLSTNFPNNIVRVYNRWGNLIFESEGYATPWDGTYNGEELPVASYYFIVDFNDGGVTKPESGTVTIVRNK